MLWKSVMVIKSTTICPSVKEKTQTLPKIILIQSEDAKALAKKVLQLLPCVNITNPNHSVSRQLVQRKYLKGEFKGIKGAPGVKGVKEPTGDQNTPCPSRRSVVYMSTDMYEVIYHVADENSVAFFRQTPVYHNENCLVENKPCCKSKTKCKTKGKLKTFAKLKMRGGKLQLATGTSNDIMRINVGQYCKCQS